VNVIKHCIPCQSSTAKEQLEPYKISTLPRETWDKVSIDFSGPYSNGEYVLVVIDEYSRYPELEVVCSTSGKTAYQNSIAYFLPPVFLASKKLIMDRRFKDIALTTFVMNLVFNIAELHHTGLVQTEKQNASCAH